MRLILIRHAKSSWSDPFANDHARVLNKRGRASARAIGAWLADNDYVPAIIHCSDAARTQETAELIMPYFDTRPKLRLSRRLYHAAPDTITDLVRKEKHDVVAVIGHNPGIGMLANRIVTEPPSHPRFHDYPTCATTIVDMATPDAKDGTCVDFIVPRDLIGFDREG
ncbi:SixA phosphatase family protein [Yoonia litorea]|uniref:Phosphohistidine phosphatase n=1 Tax=Yoonia litorea TaxID=1123755 RepID=A0A1I6L0C2_9RHOB|nr:histidine phosphatase family protein [Yoonia litorea]SFR96923.1 phosphohistidine phosphatase [Yoonia litorea]